MATKGTGKGFRDIGRPQREEGGEGGNKEGKRVSGVMGGGGGKVGRKRGGRIKSSEGHSTPPLKGSPHPASAWTSNPTPWAHSLVGDQGPPALPCALNLNPSPATAPIPTSCRGARGGHWDH